MAGGFLLNTLLMEALLGGTLVVLAVRLLWSSDLLEGIALFIAFGLILTLLWALLGAVDVALAEAAIGAGLTGALLLAAWSNSAERGDLGGEGRRKRVPWGSLLAAVAGAALGLVGQFSLAPPGEGAVGLSGLFADGLLHSGVESPVTAVLMNFRGYDTFLEVGVLVVAWIAAVGPRLRDEVEPQERGEVLAALGRMWAPLVLLVAAYIVWAGGRGPGGAFQSAAMLAGAAILLHLVGVRIPMLRHPVARRLLPVCGFAFFGLAAAAGLLSRGSLLSYPPGRAGIWILGIELIMTISLSSVLFLLYRAVLRGSGTD